MSSTAEFEEVQQREACRDARRRSAARLDLPGPIWKEFRSLAVVSPHTPSTVTQIWVIIHANPSASVAAAWRNQESSCCRPQHLLAFASDPQRPQNQTFRHLATASGRRGAAELTCRS